MSIVQLNETLAQLEPTDLRIVALSDTLADERNLIEGLQYDHVLPLELKSINCTNISQGNLTEIRASIQQIQSDLSEIEQQIEDLQNASPSTSTQNDTGFANLQLQRQWAENYLRTLEEQSIVQCPTVLPSANTSSPIGVGNVSDYTNISNFSNAQWIYGNSTPDEHRINYFKDITSKNVTVCPEATPFVLANTTNCSSCPYNTYFSVSSRQCVSCGNFTFDLNSRQCIDNSVSNATNGTNANNGTNGSIGINVTNGSIVCPTGQKFNNKTNSCGCPSRRPFYTGYTCVSCYLPNYWNETSLNCEACPPGSIYNLTLNSCAMCPS